MKSQKVGRRQVLQGMASIGLGIGLNSLLPSWAWPASRGNSGLQELRGTEFDLNIGKFSFPIGGRTAHAVGVNGTVPAPLIRFREGDEITLRVHNHLMKDTSIHWHGLLVPFQMDGVPGVTFPGIKPGETFAYKFAVPQSGTYWYHSHSGLQEQLGHYGPLIIDPKGADPVQYDREYVLVLGDWTFENPHRVFAKLKKMSDNYNYQQRDLGDFIDDVGEKGLGATLEDRAMWGAMRMSPRDISDIGAPAYTYLINGHSTADNWNGIFVPGERVRLRIINAAAMTLFNIRIPGLPMTIVQSDGLNVQPLEVDEFQMGVAETYDVIIEPKEDRAYAFVAESIDRSGQAVATLGPRPGMRAKEPALRAVPTLTMRDMGMDHGAHGGGGGHGSHDMNSKDNARKMDHSAMPHNMGASVDHSKMDHSMHAGHSGMMPDPHGPPVQEAKIERGPGVVNVAAMPVSRLDEPGIGLDNVPHRVLRYSQLRALERNPDLREPEREVVVHLTSNMERYMWSFDGVKFSEVIESIKFHEGERVRLTMVNDTMMPHPIHLHGMFFDLVNGGGEHKPRKHTVVVKPGEKLSVDVSAEHVGDWAFHCHLIYHMHAGMMQVVSVLPKAKAEEHDHHQMMKRKKAMPKSGSDMHQHHQMHHGKGGDQ